MSTAALRLVSKVFSAVPIESPHLQLLRRASALPSSSRRQAHSTGADNLYSVAQRHILLQSKPGPAKS